MPTGKRLVIQEVTGFAQFDTETPWIAELVVLGADGSHLYSFGSDASTGGGVPAAAFSEPTTIYVDGGDTIRAQEQPDAFFWRMTISGYLIDMP